MAAAFRELLDDGIEVPPDLRVQLSSIEARGSERRRRRRWQAGGTVVAGLAAAGLVVGASTVVGAVPSRPALSASPSPASSPAAADGYRAAYFYVRNRVEQTYSGEQATHLTTQQVWFGHSSPTVVVRGPAAEFAGTGPLSVHH